MTEPEYKAIRCQIEAMHSLTNTFAETLQALLVRLDLMAEQSGAAPQQVLPIPEEGAKS